MKSSSSEESVRKRSHSVGANSLAPSMLSTLTATNICDINDVIMDAKQDVIGESFDDRFHGNYFNADSLRS